MTTTVHVLGAGTPTPTPDRFGSAFALEVGDEMPMVDCGPATTWKLAKAGLTPTRIDTLFFTHHHFDHNVDYPCFLLTRWDEGSGTIPPLQVLGPPPTGSITERLIGTEGAFADDIRARMNFEGSQAIWAYRGGSLPRTRPDVLTTDIGPGHVHEGNGWTMRAAEAIHVQPWLDCLSYRLDTPDGSIVFTGDTEPCDSVRELARGADMMFAMCWSTSDAQRRNRRGLCTMDDAIQLAADAEVGTLVLVHCGPHAAADGAVERVVEAMGDVYSGRVIRPDELTSLTLSDHRVGTGG